MPKALGGAPPCRRAGIWFAIEVTCTVTGSKSDDPPPCRSLFALARLGGEVCLRGHRLCLIRPGTTNSSKVLDHTNIRLRRTSPLTTYEMKTNGIKRSI